MPDGMSADWEALRTLLCSLVKERPLLTSSLTSHLAHLFTPHTFSHTSSHPGSRSAPHRVGTDEIAPMLDPPEPIPGQYRIASSAGSRDEHRLWALAVVSRWIFCHRVSYLASTIGAGLEDGFFFSGFSFARICPTRPLSNQSVLASNMLHREATAVVFFLFLTS